MTGSPSLRAVVADDERAARDVIRTLLEQEPTIRIVGEAANGIEAVETVLRLKPDLLFLDVQMPDRDGFGVLEALGPDVPPGVVFVTAHDEHALRAFDVHALDYLLKPFGRSRFEAAIEKALRALSASSGRTMGPTLGAVVRSVRRPSDPPGELFDEGPRSPTTRESRRLGVRHGSRTILVSLDDIDWVEADGDYVRLHVGVDAHLVSRPLHELETLLTPLGYIRIHRAIIVKAARVKELRRDPGGGGVAVLSDGVQLRVARGRWEDVERALGLVP